MSHCSFCCSDARTAGEKTSQLFTAWFPWVGLPPPHSPLLTNSPICCPFVSFIEQVSQDQTRGPLSDPSWDPTETLLHSLQLVARHRGCVWSFLISSCVFWLPSWVLVSVYLCSCLEFLIVSGHFLPAPQFQRWIWVRPWAVCLVSVFVLLERIHIYIVIVHSVVPENPKEQGRFE